ncbi:MAG: AAA family ATPase, partial [Pseudomonadota bacterium]
MKVWAFANQKGGVGKTTTTITLAGLIAQQSKRVLMIDFDPHSSLTAYLGWDADTLDSSSYLLFDALSKNSLDYRICQRILMRTPFKNLYLIPGSLALATLDKKLSKLDGMGLVLEKTLELLKNDFDYVLIDCPPVVGILMVNALATCHHLIIPVQTEYLALKGLERMMRTIEMIAKAKHQKFSFTILPTMF